jgi:HAMP domain-containing protein
MRFASVAEVKNQPLSEQDSEELEWTALAKKRLRRSWQGDDDALYDHL